MISAVTALEYRHVVFPEPLESKSGAADFAPVTSGLHLPRAECEELTREEADCVRWLLREAGLDVNHYRPETIKRRMPACLRTLRVESIQDVRTTIRRRPDLLERAVSSLIIGVTSFFRDAAVFGALGDWILPGLLARNPYAKVWSVGCSDGAELYSVAMLMARHAPLRRYSMLGTDCRTEAISRARAGSYDSAAIRSVPDEMLARHFEFDGKAWNIVQSLRMVMDWRVEDVLHGQEQGLWDLILCRNMAMYLQPPVVERLWVSLTKRLRPGGFLVLGKAERPVNTAGLTAIAPCIYRA